MQIEIPEALLKRLQKHATPFVDTPVSVIEKWADFFEQHHLTAEPSKAGSASLHADKPNGCRQFDPKRPPSLLHTRVHGEFGEVRFTTWNEMVRTAHVQAFKHFGTFEDVRRITRAQIRKGTYENEGYKPIPEAGMSVQGVDADHAWEYALRLAIHLKVPLRAEFEWRNKDEAAFPGERGVMHWQP